MRDMSLRVPPAPSEGGRTTICVEGRLVATEMVSRPVQQPVYDYDQRDMGAHKKKLRKQQKKAERRSLENAIERNGHHEREKGKKKKKS